MAQWLRALTALPEDLSSNPSNHMVAHNHLEWDLMPSSGVSEDSYSVLIYINKSPSSLWPGWSLPRWFWNCRAYGTNNNLSQRLHTSPQVLSVPGGLLTIPLVGCYHTRSTHSNSMEDTSQFHGRLGASCHSNFSWTQLSCHMKEKHHTITSDPIDIIFPFRQHKILYTPIS